MPEWRLLATLLRVLPVLPRASVHTERGLPPLSAGSPTCSHCPHRGCGSRCISDRVPSGFLSAVEPLILFQVVWGWDDPCGTFAASQASRTLGARSPFLCPGLPGPRGGAVPASSCTGAGSELCGGGPGGRPAGARQGSRALAPRPLSTVHTAGGSQRLGPGTPLSRWPARALPPRSGSGPWSHLAWPSGGPSLLQRPA